MKFQILTSKFHICTLSKMQRPEFIGKIQLASTVHSVVALLGPRQSGKTTLARELFSQHHSLHDPLLRHPNYFDLEDPIDEQRLQDPLLALEPLKGLIVIDEIQRVPDLFKVIRVLVDRANSQKQFLILGSASRELIRQSSESLAGRIQYIELTPFTLDEVGALNWRNLWLRGGFPKSYLAKKDVESLQWRDAYIRTYLEQDLPNLGLSIPPSQMRRFWMMLAQSHGQIFNASEISKALQVSDVTVRRYLDILTGTFMVRELPAWFENIKKRQVKRPKIYLRDSGLFHRLLLFGSDESLFTHPKIGASWEGFAIENVLSHFRVPRENAFFWSLHGQGELDLLIFYNGKRLGFEIKYIQAPRLTLSHRLALEHLNLDRLICVYPGDQVYDLSDKVSAMPLTALSRIG